MNLLGIFQKSLFYKHFFSLGPPLGPPPEGASGSLAKALREAHASTLRPSLCLGARLSSGWLGFRLLLGFQAWISAWISAGSRLDLGLISAWISAWISGGFGFGFTLSFAFTMIFQHSSFSIRSRSPRGLPRKS